MQQVEIPTFIPMESDAKTMAAKPRQTPHRQKPLLHPTLLCSPTLSFFILSCGLLFNIHINHRAEDSEDFRGDFLM